MFEEESPNHETVSNHHNRIHQTNQQRMQRIKKTKNIRKEKVLQKRNQNMERQQSNKLQLTRQQKKEQQKQKNRVAAQLSRDRQKRYIQDLESKIVEMERQIQSQLCRKCKASLNQHFSTDDQHLLYETQSQKVTPVSTQKQYNEINILMKQPQIQSLPFVRDDSRSDIEWGTFGKYFCIILVVLAIGLLSSSIETTQGGYTPNKSVARILTEQPLCQKTNNRLIQNNTNMLSALSQIQMKTWPFKEGTGQPIEQCKNNFWMDYLQNVKKQVANPYSWNLITCSQPNLVHISTVYENALQSQQKWTFLITNPTVTHAHIQQNGNHYVDEVSYLDGIYQMVAQKVVLKKVLCKDCLA